MRLFLCPEDCALQVSFDNDLYALGGCIEQESTGKIVLEDIDQTLWNEKQKRRLISCYKKNPNPQDGRSKHGGNTYITK